MKHFFNMNALRPRRSNSVILTLSAALILSCILLAGSVTILKAGSKTCGSFYLRTSNGEIINPLTGENSDQPFSTRKTCGACHDYEAITRGFHFQQGWEKISDSFSRTEPWVLSDGMMGKH